MARISGQLETEPFPSKYPPDPRRVSVADLLHAPLKLTPGTSEITLYSLLQSVTFSPLWSAIETEVICPQRRQD